jgi:hypothetical protein
MSKRKIKVTDSQLTKHFQEVLFEGATQLNENLTSEDKNDVAKIVQKEIREFLKMTQSQSFDKLVEGMIKDFVTKDKSLEKHIVEINKKVLTQLYKSLWTRRDTIINTITV